MFKLLIEQANLAKALDYLESSVEKTGNQSYLYMCTTNPGIVQMITTNSTQYTSIDIVSCDTSSQNEECPPVSFARFKNIISTIPKDEYVEVSDNKGLSVSISYGTHNPINLKSVVATFPTKAGNIQYQPGKVELPIKDFIYALENANYIIDKNNMTLINQCVHLAVNGNKVKATSFDPTNSRAFYCDMSISSGSSNPNTSFVFEPSKLIKMLAFFSSYYDTVCVYQSGAIIKFDPIDPKPSSDLSWVTGFEYCIRQITGNFPKQINQIFTIPISEYAVLDIQDILCSLNEIKAIYDTAIGLVGYSMSLSIHDTTCVASYSSTYGSIGDEISLKDKVGFKITDNFNFTKLYDIVKAISKVSTEVCIAEVPGTVGNYIIKSGLGDDRLNYMITSMMMGQSQSNP